MTPGEMGAKQRRVERIAEEARQALAREEAARKMEAQISEVAARVAARDAEDLTTPEARLARGRAVLREMREEFGCDVVLEYGEARPRFTDAALADVWARGFWRANKGNILAALAAESEAT